MGRTRLTLHEELCTVLGNRNCYFEPPSIYRYPCIKYERESPSIEYADNLNYHVTESWMITIIDENPDSDIPRRLVNHFKTYCTKDREYPADGLQHFVYKLYY